MKSSVGAGPLVIIGGAEDKREQCDILREFVRLAGGPRARLVVLTIASEHPVEVGAEYLEVFQRLGVKQVGILDVRTRDEAHGPDLVMAIEEATGVFFTGGDQLRISNLLGGTPADQALHRRWEQGIVLGGTSAGAAMMSGTMIVSGASAATPRVGSVKIGPGLEFLRGVLIDQHFGQRGRTGRLLAALAQYPHQLGIGIDEDTALIVHGDMLDIIGGGAVTILDAGAATYNDVLERQPSQHVALCNVKLHILTAGCRFNLQDRTPLFPGSAVGGKGNERKSHES